jgi:hypothetical protein
MSNDAQRATMEEALARQNDEFETFAKTLRGLGDVELAIPHEIVDELDAATKSMANPAAPIAGIRG